MKSLTVICSLLLGVATLRYVPDHARVPSLVVGWSDEFNGLNWQPFQNPNAPDTSLRHRGFLNLKLGSGATPEPNPAPFYWGSVSRTVDVDVDRYPILAVRAVNLKGPSWWDVIVQSYGASGDPTQKEEVRLVGSEIKTPSLDHDGVILFDMQAQAKSGLELSSHRFRVRLNIAGTQKGGSVEYDWIRFVRRQDAEKLRSNPRIGDIIAEP